MTTLLRTPAAAAIIGLVLSLSIGVVVTWRAVRTGLAHAAAGSTAGDELKSKGWDFWTVEMDNLANELKDQRTLLRARADELDRREARIASGERELGKVRAELDALRKQISDQMIEAKADEAGNLRKLAQTYANLSPAAVVAIVRDMDDATAVKILSLMKPDVIGPIFEEMSKAAEPNGPQRAATLSEKLRTMKTGQPAAAP